MSDKTDNGDIFLIPPIDWYENNLYTGYTCKEMQNVGKSFLDGFKEGLGENVKMSEHTNKWIPVSERFPEEGKDVLVCNSNGEMELANGSYSDAVGGYFVWHTSGWKFGSVVAWMPLPEPYVESK